MDKNLVINKYEVALFPKDFYIGDLSLLFDEAKKIPIFADGTNITIPLPPDAPREIPRVLLKSKDDSVVCNIGFDKANIFWINKKDSFTFKKNLPEILESVKKLSDIILSHTPTHKFKRIGYIKEYYYESDTPVSLIIGKTIYKEITSKLREVFFQLTYDRNLKIYNDCNEVIFINSNAKKETDGKKVIVITSDINTIPSRDVNMDGKDIENFIKEADTLSDKKDLCDRFFKSEI